jgi:thioredoxin reductase (NADPH)
MENVHKIIIIGSGPAGFTAAIYAGRANLAPIVFEGNQPGGQLTITTEVENYPGFPDGVMGPELMEIFRKQAQRFGAQCIYQFVTDVDFSEYPYTVTTDRGEKYRGETIIISTGASAKLLGLPTEQEYMGYGVSACATCDGFFFRNLEVAVVGGGDTAMEEALFLTKFASKVDIIHRRDEFRASKIMLDRAKSNPKIAFVLDSEVAEVKGEVRDQKKVMTGLDIRNLKTGEITHKKCDGLFIGIGHKPNTDLFVGKIDMNDAGYIVTQPGSTYTNIPGVFACGDVQDPTYRQAVTAAGSGCMSAIDAERWLEKEEHKRQTIEIERWKKSNS